jgi:hypothetical protein
VICKTCYTEHPYTNPKTGRCLLCGWGLCDYCRAAVDERQRRLAARRERGEQRTAPSRWWQRGKIWG